MYLSSVSRVNAFKKACAKMNVNNERWLCLLVMENLHADSEEFLSTFRTLRRWGVEKSPVQPIVIDLAEKLKRAS